MNAIAQKSPESELDIVIDWRQARLVKGEEPAGEIGWYLAAQREGDTALDLVAHGLSGWISRATLTGGAPGASYLVSAAIATSEGRVAMRVMLVQMRAQ
tara:strand:- start:1519 stop:1815 length:297 start_codon:yes stop_codon:yes gene_type:complete